MHKKATTSGSLWKSEIAEKQRGTVTKFVVSSTRNFAALKDLNLFDDEQHTDFNFNALFCKYISKRFVILFVKYIIYYRVVFAVL